MKPQLYFILLGYVGQHRTTEKERVLGSGPTWLSPSSTLRIKQLYFRCCKDFFNENDGKSSDIVNIYYVLTTLSAEHVLAFKTIMKGRQPPSFIKRNIISEGLGLMTTPYFSRKKRLVQRGREQDKVTRGLKAEKADTLKRGLCHIHAKSAEMIILPLPRDYGSICFEFCKKHKGQK